MPIQKSPDAMLIEQSLCSQHPFPFPLPQGNPQQSLCQWPWLW